MTAKNGTNSDILDSLLELQHGFYFNELTSLANNKAVLTFSTSDKSSMCNFVLLKSPLTDQQIYDLEQECLSKNRKPSFYFERTKEFESLISLIGERGYKLSYVDAWMFFEEKTVGLPDIKYKVVSVSNEQELQVFLDTFKKCYQSGDPQNPYGDLGTEGYLKTISDPWHRYGKTDRMECFIFYNEDEPVAISELVSYQDMGFILNVGSVQNVRGRGFGKLATLYGVRRSMEKGNRYHSLVTEEDHYPHKFYEKIGFTTKFIAVNYLKE